MEVDQSEKPVGTCMIGTGNRGSFLLQSVLRQPNAKVLALCDIKPDRLDKAATAAARDNPATYPDWKTVLERKDVDAVFIATPPYLHSEMAIQAIKAGKHVYCEKPLGVTAAQVRALLAAAKGSTKVFVAGQQLRSQKGLAETVRCGSLTYDYPNGVKMSFTQNVFHPASMPHGNQYVYVYGTKGAVDLMTASLYPPGRGSQPIVLSPTQPEDQFAHIAAFFDSIVNGTPPPVDVKGGATAALTAILGHEAMVQEKVAQWSDFGVGL